MPIAVNSWSVIGGANCEKAYYGPRVGTWYLECLTELTRHAGSERLVDLRSAPSELLGCLGGLEEEAVQHNVGHTDTSLEFGARVVVRRCLLSIDHDEHVD